MRRNVGRARSEHRGGKAVDVLTALNGKAVDHGDLLFVAPVIATINIDRPDPYQRVGGARYHVNV